MPSINLPTITINKEDFKSKETMENILDTLMKYRKELNYLLMNLDTDNMPLVGGLIGELEGDFSLLTQTVDGIYAQVGNIEGDFADFRIKADEISGTVTNLAGDIGTLSIKADEISGIVANQEGDIAALQLQADSISGIVTNQSGDIAALVVRATSIESTVGSHTGAISAVTQTANGLVSIVADLNTSVGGFYSEVNQLAGSITSKVSYDDYNGNKIASLINQTATTIKIEASKIELTGVTRIVSPTHSNSYAEFSSMTDFTIHSGGNPVFSIYNGTDYAALKSFGVSHLRLGHSKAIAEGEWDFQGTVKGLTARFG